MGWTCRGRSERRALLRAGRATRGFVLDVEVSQSKATFARTTNWSRINVGSVEPSPAVGFTGFADPVTGQYFCTQPCETDSGMSLSSGYPMFGLRMLPVLRTAK